MDAQTSYDYMTRMATAQKSSTASRVQPRRERIVDVATEMFSRMEYEEVSVDELCRKAGVAKGLAFYHFQDKQGLFAAAIERVWSEMAIAQLPLPDEETVVQRMYGNVRRRLEYLMDHPHYARILMPGHSSASVDAILQRARNEAMARITAALGCPADPPPRLRQALTSWSRFTDHLVIDWIKHKDTTINEMCDLCVQVLVAAVHAANGRPFNPQSEFETLAQVIS